VNRRTKYLLWFFVATLVMACMPVMTSAPLAPTLDPNAINRIIAQTANAAITQTVAAYPTSPPTKTSTPRGTMTLESTATLYVFHTSTAFVIPPASKTFSPTSKKDYACEVLDAPVDGTYYSPRLEFKVRWRFKNVGRKEWEAENVDFVYDTGDKFHKVSGYDLSKDRVPGEVAEFFVDMRAPKNPGTYTAYWIMRRGGKEFCRVAYTIGVR
jgi:hypothetical protein